MTTQAVKIELQVRDLLGKKVKQLRRLGIIPVHLYGPDTDSRSLQCEQREILRALASSGGTTPINVSIEGESGEQLTFAREVQWHPVRGDILHVDFFAVTANQTVASQVPLILTGESAGARQVGGTVVLQMREVTVEALPLEIPSEIEINIDRLVEPTDVFRAGDISVPGNVAIITDSEEVVARIEVSRTSQPITSDGGEAGQSTDNSPGTAGSPESE